MLFNQLILKKEYAYIIAELGNNHQGSFDLALKMVDEAISCGVNAVKFQRRRNTLQCHMDSKHDYVF